MNRSGIPIRAEVRWWALLPWLVAALVAAPLVIGGLPQGHDWSFELVRVAEYRHALADGQLPPAWAPDLYGGYGSPIFLFYAPIFAALSVALAALSGSFATGAVWALIAITLAAVPATRSMSASTAGAGDAGAQRVGVYLLLLNPYLVGNLYLRNANAEYAALCLAPLAISGLAMIGERPRRGALTMAAGLALVLLAHNLTALVLAAILLVGAMSLYLPRRDPGPWLAAGGGGLLGLSIAAFFWIPALVLKPLMRTEELLTGKFDFHNNFASPADLFGYEAFFSAGLLTPLVWCAGAVALVQATRVSSSRVRILWTAMAGVLVFVIFATRVSVAAWESLPLLPLFQFPWRMMGPAALMTSIVGAAAYVELTRDRSTRVRRAVELAVLVLCLANAAPHLWAYRPIDTVVRERMEEQLSPSAIRDRGYAATVGDEYLPRAADRAAWKRPRPPAGPIASATSRVEIDVTRDRGTSSRLEVRAGQPVELEFARWAFPAWTVSVGGTRRPVQATALGTLGVDLDSGAHAVELDYHPPAVRVLTLGMSLLAALAWMGLVLGIRRSRR